MSDDQIQEIVQEVLALVLAKKLRFPSPPTVITKINQMLNAPGSTVADMVKLVQTHPVLSAKLLQVSNSAALHRGAEITSLTDAIQRLGYSFVRNLALSLTLREKFSPVSPLVQQMVSEIWDHSVHIGALSTLMAQYLVQERIARVDSSISLLVGIIHSIGEIPLMEFALQKGYKPHIVMSFPEEAKRRLSIGVLETWDIPDLIVDAVNEEGAYGAILKYTHAFLQGEPVTTFIKGKSNVPHQDFEAFVTSHESTITELKATFK